MKDLVVCIPTYNRDKIIQEFLDMCLKMYHSYGIDVYIYDSSTNCLTEEIVKNYEGYEEYLFYKRIDSQVHSNEKYFRIYEEFIERNDYRYVWNCGDALRWTEEAIQEIMQLIKHNYEIIVVNHLDKEKKGKREYTDANELFSHHGWHMTLYGLSILSVPLFLRDVNWNAIREKYMDSLKINYSHVGMMFERMVEMNEIYVFHLPIPPKCMITSELKKSSGWHQETFYMVCQRWPATVMALPEYYQDKKRVIKIFGEYSNILNWTNMLKLRTQGIYNMKIFWKYFFQWKNVIFISMIKLFGLALLPKEIVDMMVSPDRHLVGKFCKNYQTIYIYGCGQKAKRFARYMEELELEYAGFLNSDVSKLTEHTMNHHNIIQFSEDLLKEKNTGFLIALNNKNYKEVCKQYPMIAKKRNVLWIKGKE